MTLGPSQVFTKDNIKVRWGERYTSDALNKKFLGIPRGVYLGFAPSATGLVLSLLPDRVITFSTIVNGPFSTGDVIQGGTSLTNAVILAVSSGFVLIGPPSGGTGSFQPTENVTVTGNVQGPASSASGTVSQYVVEAISFARTVSNTPLVPNRSEDVVDIVTGDVVSIDFTGFNNGTYYVFATGSYSVGASTVGTISSRTAPPPNGVSEVLVCVVTKSGLTLTIQADSPAHRQEPFATAGSRIGFMPGGSIDQLIAAALTTAEVSAAHRDTAGTLAPLFDNGAPQTTGLPGRLASDLSRSGMAHRIGKRLVETQGNDYVVGAVPTGTVAVTSGVPTVVGTSTNFTAAFVPGQLVQFGNQLTNAYVIASIADNTHLTLTSNFTGTTGSTTIALTGMNISGSFAGRVRDHQPFKDDTTTNLPPGQTLNLGSIVGTFTQGEVISGTSGTTAIIQSVSGSSVVVYSIYGHGFNPGEALTGASSGATATVGSTAGGIRIPIVIDPNASDVTTLSVSATFGAGTLVTGDSSKAQGVVRASGGGQIDLDQLYGVFRKGETLNSGASTVTGISDRTGVITAASGGGSGDTERNLVTIIDTATGKKPVNSAGLPIYGRLIFGPSGAVGSGGNGGDPGELLVATGANQQIQFSPGGITDVNANINFTNYCLPGDILEGADGRFYEIELASGSVTSTAITVTPSKSYLGSGGGAGLAGRNAGNTANVGPGPRRRRRYFVQFVTLSGGSETLATIASGINISSTGNLRFFFPCWFTEEQSNFDASFTRSSPGDGTFIAAADGSDTTPGHIVQTNDVRLGRITAELNSAGLTGLEPILNFINGTGISIAVAEVGGKINITITNSSPGGGGPSPGSNIQSVVPGGSNSAGSGTAYALDNHVHAAPAYPAAPFAAGKGFFDSSRTSAFTITIPNPRLAVCAFSQGSNIFGVGVLGWDGTTAFQGSWSVGPNNQTLTTHFIATVTQGNWDAGSFSSTGFTVSPSGVGANAFAIAVAAVGS